MYDSSGGQENINSSSFLPNARGCSSDDDNKDKLRGSTLWNLIKSLLQEGMRSLRQVQIGKNSCVWSGELSMQISDSIFVKRLKAKNSQDEI